MLLGRSIAFLLLYAWCWICAGAAPASPSPGASNDFKVGVGIGDITGPVSEVLMFGYADIAQVDKGLLQRLYARAFIIADGSDRVVFVNTDTGAMGDIVKKRVVQRLQALYGNKVYTEQNVLLSSTHSHSGMGGYLQHALYEISVLGWIEETTKPMVDGIVNAIVRAHDHLKDGSVTVSRGELLDSNISRSPQSYLLNPEEERAQYKYDVDKEMTLLGLHDADGNALGFLNWFAVHGVSMNKSNHLVNGDNKGYAAYITEKKYNGGLPGKGPFVAGFFQANEGDVTPNTLGPVCSGTDIPCDGTRDTKCPGTSTCNGRGPGWKIGDIESNRIIGQNQADKAIELFEKGDTLMKLAGPIDYRQKFWDISKAVIQRQDGSNVSTCAPAMGYAFAAGTTDGPGLSVFYQNTTEGNPFWDFVAALIKAPSKEQQACQQPKPILLNTGEVKIPYEWQPRIIDVQLIRIGNMYIAAVPSEMTTMSGRRLRNAIKKVLIEQGVGNNDTIVIQSGPANGYASYCATYEEYQMQRYEGASTPYGQHTLEAYIQVFTELATSLAKGEPVTSSEKLPDYTGEAFNLTPSFPPDNPGVGKSFGDVAEDVASGNFSRAAQPVVSATFVAGNPRNNVMQDGTYLTIEQKQQQQNKDTAEWTVVRVDDDYDTRFHWSYGAKGLGLSQARIEWHLDDKIPEGTYRIGYFGHHKKISGDVQPHQGYSSEFTVLP